MIWTQKEGKASGFGLSKVPGMLKEPSHSEAQAVLKRLKLASQQPPSARPVLLGELQGFCDRRQRAANGQPLGKSEDHQAQPSEFLSARAHEAASRVKALIR